ncbi:MAG: hypothetical protein JO103_08790, partial [Candidatus Eremiobacteraeota bacterium]|nr:hypothetical protein [Candidatus Eremiobacteraeota bacterium]
ATDTFNRRQIRDLADLVRRRLPDGETVGVLGLTYKPGTDTLRASTAVALARVLHERGADVVAYDPAVPADDARLVPFVRTVTTAAGALHDTDVAVVATAWPAFRDISDAAFGAMRGRVVIDPARFLEDRLSEVPSLRYLGFGRAPALEGAQ